MVMTLVHKIIPYLLSRSVKNSGNSCLYSPRLLVNRFLTSDANTVVNAICDSLRRGNSWDILSRNFDYVELNYLLVENVLLELKEPTDAKRALGFFHWSAQRKNFVHEVQTYCLMVNILVRAQLLMDAQALLESVLKRRVGDSSKFFNCGVLA